MANIDFYEEIMNIEDLDIYCHFTDKNPELIINQGLKLLENDWHTTLLKLTNEERENLKDFIAKEKSVPNNLNFRDFAIILAIPKEMNGHFIEKSDDFDMPYIINSELVVGSINTDNFETILNEDSLAWDYILYR